MQDMRSGKNVKPCHFGKAVQRPGSVWTGTVSSDPKHFQMPASCITAAAFM